MNHASFVLHRAESLLDRRSLHLAIHAFDRAQALGAAPDRCSAGRWKANMLLGRFAQAWQESDAIRERGEPDPHRFWNGESIEGKRVIVRCLHGFGDAIQFLRYIPALRQRAAHVLVEVPPHLLDLARTLEGLGDVITWGEAAPAVPPQWDVQVEVTELPYLFRSELRDLPASTGLLRLPAALQARAARTLGTSRRPQIGVVWSSGEWNPGRSIPIAELKPILNRTDCDFWNLQGGSVRGEWPAGANLHDAPAFCDAGLLPLAGFISQLDLVITVDTFAAHMAGTLGIPTWVLLRQEADWRWMVRRDDSPWYPSVRLFRQTTKGNWTSVVSRLNDALALWFAAPETRKAVA